MDIANQLQPDIIERTEQVTNVVAILRKSIQEGWPPDKTSRAIAEPLRILRNIASETGNWRYKIGVIRESLNNNIQGMSPRNAWMANEWAEAKKQYKGTVKRVKTMAAKIKEASLPENASEEDRKAILITLEDVKTDQQGMANTLNKNLARYIKQQMS
jgi:hypothetical protein